MFTFDKNIYNPLAKSSSTILGEKYRITILTDALIRFEYAEDGVFTDDVSTTVINRDFPEIEFKQYDRNGLLYVETAKLILKYDEQAPSNYGLQIKVLDSAIVWHYGDEKSDHYRHTNLGGTIRTLDTIDGETNLGEGLISRLGYTVIDDSKTSIIDSEGWFKARESANVDLYFFGHGLDYQAALDDFFALSGHVPLLPRFALGNWWSRYHAYDEEEYKELITNFEKYEIPVSVSVIDMDWHVTEVDPKYGTGWTGYTWNTDLFPDPEAFLNWLHERGLKTTLNVHPADGIRPFEQQYEEMCLRLGLDPMSDEGIEFDFTNPDFIKAYLEVINHQMENEGVDFWWLDWQQGTVSRMSGLDPLWPLNHFYFMDGQESRENNRSLIFSRYAGLGSHRYPVGFSGDTIISWESLDFQPYFTSTATNVGYTWWSHDIGGHMNGAKDDELQIRWLQYGVFSPIMRLHSSSNIFMTREPWKYGEVAKTSMTESLRLRYRLIPYLYTMNFLTAYENKPLVKPLYFEEPDNRYAYEVKNEYYFGTQLLVCPITKPINKQTSTASFDAWIPEGDYFDFFNGRHYLGGKAITLHRNIYETPVLAKAGAIVPMDNAEVLENAPRNPESLLLKVFTGADGSFDLIEDNGLTARPRDEELAITKIEFDYNYGVDSKLIINPVVGDVDAIADYRNLEIQLYGVNNTEFEIIDTGMDMGLSELDIVESRYDEIKHCLSIRLNSYDVREGLCLLFRNTEIADNEFVNSAFKILDEMQFSYDLKAEIFYILKMSGNTASTISELYANDKYPREVVDVIAELYYAAK